MTAVIPPRVARGQTVGVVVPSGPIRLERLRRGLACLGDSFELRIATSATAARAPGTPSYLAAPDEVRAAEVNAMLADPDVRAIIFARGGYGAMRTLPLLDPDLLARDPKPIVGFSDATAMLSWAYLAGVRGIHGPTIGQLSDLPPSDVAHLVALLTEPRAPGLRPWSLQLHGRGVHRGPLIPANLTLASLLVGTPWPLPLAGAIALFEEIRERPYEIDRYLTQLTLTGALASTTAAVIGELIACHDPNPPSGGADPNDAALAALLERLHSAGIPTAVGAPIGHGARNEAVSFGAHCELDLDRGTFAILEPAVA
jgi:muramoyltetrapeptide carboxypeptidase